jgi:hypothetical protein
LNAKFEASKLRSQYVIENLKLLNNDTAELLASVGEYTRASLRGGIYEPQVRTQIERRISTLQWRAIEYDILFSEKTEAKSALTAYRRALDGLGGAVDGARGIADANGILAAAREVGITSHEMIRLLSNQADVRAAFRETK